jgi:glycosyltransferase involved in cell wall biosynthesis
MKLSVAVIAKNESAVLEKCLASVKGADEIVVVDTGSEDNTVEIAKKFTDKVYTDFKWCDHFGKARQHAMDRCTGDWILSIDADDRLAPGGIEQLRKIIAKYPAEYCFNIQFITEQGARTHKLPYIYKNCKGVTWAGAAHNYISKAARLESGTHIVYGYSPSHKKDPDRTFRILKQAVKDNPDKPRELYYLSREYRYKKDWINCLYYTEKYLKVAFWPPEIADAWLMKARCLWHLQRGEEARDACLMAIKYNTNFKEAVLLMAEMTGPINRDRWLLMAEFADSSNVLFNREKVEKDAAYYEKINDTEPRYDYLYKAVGDIAGSKRILDIGCGQGKLSKYIENYAGFDMVKNPYLVADIYTHEYGDYDAYVLLEVLEHLTRDIDIIKKIPVGKEIVFSVPSFDDPSHVRMFTPDIIRWRYRDVIKIKGMIRFNFDDKERKWKTDFPATPSYITLCRGRRV